MSVIFRKKNKKKQHCEYSSHISIQISWCEEKTSEPKKQSVRINSLQTPEYVYWRGHIFVRIIHIIVQYSIVCVYVYMRHWHEMEKKHTPNQLYSRTKRTNKKGSNDNDNGN